MAKHQFQTEANQILDLMIHSLYSNKEIFIREYIRVLHLTQELTLLQIKRLKL